MPLHLTSALIISVAPSIQCAPILDDIDLIAPILDVDSMTTIAAIDSGVPIIDSIGLIINDDTSVITIGGQISEAARVTIDGGVPISIAAAI